MRTALRPPGSIAVLLPMLLGACARELPPPPADGVDRVDGRTEASFDASIDRTCCAPMAAT